MKQDQSYSPVVTVTPTVSTTPAYTANDVVGSIMTFDGIFSPARTGLLKNITVRDASNQKPNLTIIFFHTLPTGTYTDNGAFAWGSADFAKALFKVDIASTDWTTINSKAIASVEVAKNICNRDASDVNAAKLYAVCLTTGTPTFVAVTDVSIDVGALPD